MQKFSAGEKIIHDQFVQYGRNAKEWTRKCVLLLPKIEKLEIWKKKGLSSIYEYAAKLAGINHDAVDDALRILDKIKDKPVLMSVVEEKGINAVRPVVTIATQETMVFWAGKAREMSHNTLQTYVREFRKSLNSGEFEKEIGGGKTVNCEDGNSRNVPGEKTNSEFSNSAKDGLQQMKIGNSKEENEENLNVEIGKNEQSQSIQKLVGMYLDTEILAQLEKLKGQGSWNDLMKKFLEMRENQIEEQKPEAATTANPGNCRELSRYIPAIIRNYLIEKFNGLCAFPHCKQPYQIIHHTQRWALKHQHDPDKMVLLCKGHERLFHLGLIENEEGDSTEWKIKLGAETNDPKYEVDKIVQKFRMLK